MIFSFKRKRIISSVNLAIIISLLSFNAFSAKRFLGDIHRRVHADTL